MVLHSAKICSEKNENIFYDAKEKKFYVIDSEFSPIEKNMTFEEIMRGDILLMAILRWS